MRALFDDPVLYRKYQNMRRRVKRERIKYKALGFAWTPYRPFHDGTWERVGAARCCASGRHTPGRVTVVVSYSTHINGRTALCAKHYKQHLSLGTPP